MEDKTTPQLKPEGHDAILTGSDFLTGREAHLQGRLEELEAELAILGDAPDDIESLEQQALDALRTVSDLLEPPNPAPATSPPEPIPDFLPTVQERQRRSEAVNRRRPWRIAGIVAVLLVATLLTFAVVWVYGPELVGDDSPATVVVQATVTHTPAPPTPTTIRPTRPPVTATPVPSPTIAVPVIPEAPGRNRESIRAATVQIFEVSGTLQLELPLSVMADTVQVVEGIPVLQPVLPASGAGVHQGSASFGEMGRVMVAISAGTAPVSLWQTRPGDQLIGCNSDGACHKYQVAAADTWPLERLRQILANWPPDATVLLYAVLDESSAWVIQAQPLHREGTR